MKRAATVSVLVLGMALALLIHNHRASASGPMQVTVTLRDYRVIVSEHHLPVDKPITFIVKNRGHHTHELVLEPAKAYDRAIRFHGKSYEADEIKPRTTRTVTWTIPRSGRYKFACHIDHHYQKGMRTLVIAGRA